jgi:O-antigen/teichoic acid export membrane protein
MSGPTTGEAAGLRGKLSQAVAWNVIFTPIKFIIDLASNIIRINLLTKAEVGTLSLFSSATSLVGVWIDLGIDQALPKAIPEIERAGGHGAVRRFLNHVIALKMLILALTVLALPWWGGWVLDRMERDVQALVARFGADVAPLQAQLDNYRWLFLAAVAALLVLGSLDDTLKAYLISFFRQKAWNMITAISALMLPILSAAAVLADMGVLGVLGALIITALASVLITQVNVSRAMRRAERAEQPAPLPPGTWRRFLPYTAMSFLLSVTDLLTSQYFGVYWLSGIQEVALYWVAFSVIKQVQTYVYAPMGGLQVPLFTQVRAEGDVRLARVFGTVARLFLVLFVPSGILLMVFLHNLVLIQFPDYAGALPAAMVALPFLFFEPFWGLGHNVLMVHENYRLVIVSRLASLASIPLLLLLAPLGAPGIAAAMGIGRSLAGMIVITGALRRYRLEFPWRFAGKLALASLLAAAAVVGPMYWWVRVPVGTTGIAERLLYALASSGLGMVALVILIVCIRQLRLIHNEDRALLAEMRHPMARRLQRFI